MLLKTKINAKNLNPNLNKTFTNSTHLHNFTPIQHIPIYHAPKIIVLIYIGKVFNRINAYKSLFYQKQFETVESDVGLTVVPIVFGVLNKSSNCEKFCH